MELMTIDEVAKYLKVTKRTVYNLIKYHKMPRIKFSKILRFDCKDIDKWLMNYKKSEYNSKQKNVTALHKKINNNKDPIKKKKYIDNLCIKIRDNIIQKKLP